MNIIHNTESDVKEIPDGQVVRTKCGKKLVFRSHGTKPPGGVFCQLCYGFRSIAGHPPFILAVFEDEKPCANGASI